MEKKWKKNLIIGAVSIGLLTAGILTYNKAMYQKSTTNTLINSTKNYELNSTNLVGVYIQDGEDYTKTDTIPEEGYTLNQEKSYCKVNDSNIDATISYDAETKTLSVSPLTTKGTKCYLYFDEQLCTGEACNTILAGKTLATRTDFSTTLTTDTTRTIYYEDTSKGTTYYFAGNPTDNWVRFAGFYWRIVRINEDGSIRLIYNGTGTGTTGTSTQIQTSAFNSSHNNNMYVGYMYQRNQVHGLTTDSTIKIELDQWYEENLQSHADKISTEAGFCGDRTPYTNTSETTSGGGTGTKLTYYAGYIRLITNKQPSFECSNSSDLYTTSGSSQGNKSLTYPIGLISADEVAYAGGVYFTNNTSYYLYTGQGYWTMSPRYFIGSNADVFIVYEGGDLNDGYVNVAFGVRPVVNLKADVTITGEGTSSNPYTIS